MDPNSLDRKPAWLKTPLAAGRTYTGIKKNLRVRNLVTVCEEAKCPNIGECWGANTATFMVLGDTCTRACRFCNVKTGQPNGWLDAAEPQNVADSCKRLGLRYVVITMVDRDDLADGGSSHVAQVLETVQQVNPGIRVELLAGDFKGDTRLLPQVLAAAPVVYAHNVETVARLTPRVRDRRASYQQSLASLAVAKRLASYPVLTKSALMLGLGETDAEVEECLRDLRAHQVDLITVGQYMRPSKQHLSVKQWVVPERFQAIEALAYELGFRGAACGPLVRSSYRAREFYERITTEQGVGGEV